MCCNVRLIYFRTFGLILFSGHRFDPDTPIEETVRYSDPKPARLFSTVHRRTHSTMWCRPDMSATSGCPPATPGSVSIPRFTKVLNF
jgi:hypothetical protein